MTNILKMCLATLLFTTVVSCKDEKKDASNPTQQEMMAGQWKMEKFEQTGDTRNDNDSVVNTFSHYGSDFTGSINFNSSGTYSSNLEFDFNMSVTQGGSTSTASFSANLMKGNGTWEIDANDNLIIDKNNDPWELEVSSLSESKLVVKAVDENSVILLSGDTATEYSTTVISFKK